MSRTMDVVWDAAGSDQFPSTVADDPADVGVQVRSPVGEDEGLAVLGAEHEVVEQLGVRLGHDERPSGAGVLGTVRVPGLPPRATDGTPLRGEDRISLVTSVRSDWSVRPSGLPPLPASPSP